MDCSPPGSSVHGIFQARILDWVAIYVLLKLTQFYLLLTKLYFFLIISKTVDGSINVTVFQLAVCTGLKKDVNSRDNFA